MLPRGPDADGLSEYPDGNGGNCYLAHRRLSIQDLTASGNQPMQSADGRYAIVYNGEVYNTLQLREQLEQKGVRFRSRSDTEVILEGYAVWGEAVIEKLNGMFAIAIWDRVEHRMFLARDRVGIKPLYVSVSEQHIAFASDVRALRSLGLCEAVDPQSLSLYLALGYVPAPRSIWVGIQKLEAGSFMHWRAGATPHQHSYWSAPDDTDYEGSAETLENLVDTVVEEQLLSDVPVGLFLSGGLDSSLVASSVAALRERATEITTMAVGFPGNSQWDEAPIAKRTAAQLGFRLNRLEMTGDTQSSVDAAVAAMDEPIAYNAIVTQAGISRLAADAGFKVVLTGDGGDEVFGGYRWHYPAQGTAAGLHRPKRRFVLSLKERARQISAELAREFHAKSPYFAYMRRVFAALRSDEIVALVPNMSQAHVEELLVGALARYDAPRLPEKRRLQRIDLYTFCQDSVLPKVDRTGMAFGVEARPPLLDHRIVDWGLSRPITDLDDSFPKNAVRRILQKRGLDFLLQEPKRGFSLRNPSISGRQMRELVSQNSAGLGISRRWHRTVHRRSESYPLKLETLYWLSRWYQAHGVGSA